MPGSALPLKAFKGQDCLDCYCCSYCKLILKEPVQLICGHCICKSCADEVLEKSNSRCPECDEEFIQGNYFPDCALKREIMKLAMKCPLSEIGCTWEGTFEEYYNNHVDECGHQNNDVKPFAYSVDYEQGELVQCDGSKAASSRKKTEDSPHVDESGTIQTILGTKLTLQDRLLKMEDKVEMLAAKDIELQHLKVRVNKIETQICSKNAALEDHDFRLSLVENSNYDGSMIWKIPQFSQRKADAENGKYTSIFSLPFYSGRYGYKMCLRLYIMGDGIGKGTHLSLFFVVMRGEFDNILQWPFTHKVTFKLINQAGGRDIVDSFQPDPMSSSFRKPRSDMNIASGCPRFVSHTELERGGFIVDDTVFIKCMIDTSTIQEK